MKTLISDGQSSYQVLIPHRPDPVAQQAAADLQDALLAMTGALLPITPAASRLPGQPAIIVGQSSDTTLEDSFTIQPAGDDLHLFGTNGRGTHYAVAAFLQSLGARFYGPDLDVLPRLRHVALPEAAIHESAAFTYRHVFYPTAQTPRCATRWRLNVHGGREPRWGANARAHSWGHSFSHLVPVDEHFAAHPEYFSLIDGRRRDRQTQLCCTNPAVADVACQTMSRWIADNPDQRIFAVGMNDWDGWCECPECSRVDRREGGPTGQLLTLVNRVAERFPDRLISTLAYAWAIDPPREMQARDNVLIVLCHNEGCYTHPLAGCPHNARFLERLRGWKDKSRHILIWDYYVNYHSYLMPTPNFRRIAQDFRTYRDLGIDSMFCQGSAVPGGQFEGLRQYLQARLLWNPHQDLDALMADYLIGVYGKPAGARILEYLQMLEDHVHTNDVHMTSFGSGQEIQPHIFTPEILKRGQELWDEAERLADGPFAPRVFAARAPEMCSRLFHTGMTYHISGRQLRPDPPPDTQLRDRFVEAAILSGARCLRENAGTPESFRTNFGRTYEAIELTSDRVSAVIIPELGARLYSLRLKPSGMQLMHMAELARKVNFLPYGSGYEFSLQPRWQGPASSETYRVITRESSRTVMEADLADALHIQTEFVLTGNALQVRHTVTNRGAGPATVAPFTHPEWNYLAFGDAATLSFTSARGPVSMSLNPDGRHSRDLIFSGDDMPAGAWTVTSALQSFTLTESFDPAVIDHVRLTFGGFGNLNLELYYKPITLPSRSSQTFATCWKLEPLK